MGSKKMGRPTDNPKDILLKVRLDKGAAEKLDECVHVLAVSKADTYLNLKPCNFTADVI